MATFSSSSSGPPNLFNDGRLRDDTVATDRGHERFQRAISREAAEVPLPHSPVTDDRLLFDIPIEERVSLQTEQTKGGSSDSAPMISSGNESKIYNRQKQVAEEGLANIFNLFRLLDLYQEQGSGGLVEKVLIDQGGLRRLLNTLLPGSYESVSKIDFKALDKCAIKPMGIYGSKLEIIRFLYEVNCLNDNSKRLLLESVGSPNDLRSGLYLALPPDREFKDSNSECAYILYWPEDSTWDDKAISSVRRNRITFMRYLSKLTDQMIALVSSEQAGAMVWTSGRQNDRSIQSDIFDESRMFSFEVEKSTEQEEDALATSGFTIMPDTRNIQGFTNATKICLVPGEEKSGLMTSSFKPATTTTETRNETMFSLTFKSMVQGRARPIVLGELTGDQLKILAEHGLREAYPAPFVEYEKRLTREEEERKREYNASMQAMKDSIGKDKDQLKHLIGLLLRERYSKTYPSIGISPPELGSPDFEHLRKKYIELANIPRSFKANSDIGTITDSEFKDLKLAWHTVREYLLQDQPPPPDQQAKFVSKILGDSLDGEWATVTKGKGSKRGFTFSFQAVKDAVSGFFGYEAKPPATMLSDPEFVQALGPLAEAFPILSQLTGRISTCLHAYLENLGKRLVKRSLERIVDEEAKRLKDLIGNERRRKFQDESEATARTLLSELRSVMPFAPSNNTRIDYVGREQVYGDYPPPATKLRVRSEHTSERGPRLVYTIYPLELTEHDIHQCRSNDQHIPQPRLSTKQFFKFSLDEKSNIKFVQLVRDKCLVIIGGLNQFDIYLDDNVHLPRVIEQGTAKRSIKYDRVGDPGQCIFAFDEGTRSLAVFHSTDLKGPELSLYGFDETLTTVQARGSPFSLKECPASVQISSPVVDAFSAPDGSCLLVSVATGEESLSGHKLLVFHWASFGARQSGISPAVLPSSSVGRIVTSFEGRSHIHLLTFSTTTMAATSVALSIKQKATEFSFRSNQSQAAASSTETVNNCLLDCHMDVWTRFPVAPAVTRSTLSSLGREPRKLVFASSLSTQPVDSYFSRMITKFERTTCKPIDAELRSISVVALSEAFSTLVRSIQCSRYPLGSFIVEFICLIPLHLAITRDNRFIPLKDGVWDPEHERSLLGADVPAIINSLSIGWYESLFQSYMATKPVRVVSSMGEQSVGKSYCLNHFADTTFAGSAMRTTEGVWLSCTPTKDYLLVSLDFEGVHSIERSAQEDALLVLFNTAISNLVLFRNNFALSRDIAGLFQSFQSSAMVLDPESNPSLFNSTLAIIIKDVTDSDSKDIVKEFSLKFQKIVQKEQEQNFISRLHRGKVQIIPWPVINSSSFYTLFNHLRRYLDGQPVTHPSGGVFLHNMKTLMAKIKASDWGSLDQNLATHRAQQLERELHAALSRGSTDQDDIQTPLRNLDTDEEVATMGPDVVFFVPDISGAVVQGDEAETEQALGNLVHSCLASSSIGPRHVTGDKIYIESLQQQLFDLLDQRLEHVRGWVQANVQRFPPGNQDIRNVHNKIDATALVMRGAVRLCAETCSSCNYLCTRPHRHSEGHDCGTTHGCPFSCEVSEAHPEPVGCGLPAGHSAQHMCDIKAHSCGQDCDLIDKNGCARSCVKPMYHDGGHLCSSRLHSCGEACSLADVSSGYRCPGPCNLPWDEPHTLHRCSNSGSCPMECQLCRRLCHEPDHFHGLDPNAVHLCGQAHSCTSPCAARGVCRIETQPSTVEEQFSGRHEAFQYTRYTQVEQRLTCVIPIPPGELDHAGEHSHTTDANAFHYCNARCPSCQYLCTLPLGHPQQLHETSHGSMTTTQWAIQGTNQDARYELDGRNFGIGDEGAPMLCHLVCSAQGRHAHIDFCREPDTCRGGAELEHIRERMHPEPNRPKDWISHRLKWARSGFQDPYSREQQAEFAKCDVLCPGPEHNATTSTAAANPSYCNLPIFHPPHSRRTAATNGYVSADGHRFDCVNPARLQQSYHVVFVIDSSGSMGSTDRTPLPDTPVSQLLRGRCNNRYGAVLSALHSFWQSRETGNATAQRQDAYSVITFNSSPRTWMANDFTSTTNQLLSQLLQNSASGGTNFNSALAHARTLIQSHWNSDKTPALVFLSDGQCSLDRNTVYDLCRTCIQLGKPLAFYSVSFGPENSSGPLREMVQIAREVYASAPRNTLGNIQGDACAYYNAVDEIQLANTFLGISNSLHKPRASLIGQTSGRRAI